MNEAKNNKGRELHRTKLLSEEITIRNKRVLDKFLARTGIISNFSTSEQLLSFVASDINKVFLVHHKGQTRCVVKKETNQGIDLRILFTKTDQDAELIEGLQTEYKPIYMAYNLIPTAEKPIDSQSREDLVLDVATIAGPKDSKTARPKYSKTAQEEYNRFRNKHVIPSGDPPKVRFQKYEPSDKPAVEQFLHQWSKMASTKFSQNIRAENDRNFLEMFASQANVTGGVVYDGNKVIGICFHFPHPTDPKLAVNIIFKNLRGYSKLGEWMTVEHFRQIQEEGYTRAVIGGTENPSQAEFKRRFSLNGSANHFNSEKIYSVPDFLEPDNYLRDFWKTIKLDSNPEELLLRLEGQIGHEIARDIEHSSQDTYLPLLDSERNFTNFNKKFVSVLSEEKDSYKMSALNAVFLKDHSKLTKENLQKLIKNIFSHGVLNFSDKNYTTDYEEILANTVAEQILNTSVFYTELNRQDLLNTIIDLAISARKADSLFYKKSLQVIKNVLLKLKIGQNKLGMMPENIIISPNINSYFEQTANIIEQSDLETNLSPVLSYIKAITYYLVHQQELIYLQGFTYDWQELGGENLANIGTALADIYRYKREKITSQNALSEINFEDIEKELPGIGKSFEKFSFLLNSKDLSIEESEQNYFINIQRRDRNKIVICPKNNPKLLAAGLEQAFFFYEQQVYEDNFTQPVFIQMMVETFKTKSQGQVKGQSIADWGFITSEQALEYANTPSGRLEHERHERFHLYAWKRWPNLKMMSLPPEVLEGIPYAYFNRVDPKGYFLYKQNPALLNSAVADRKIWNPELKGAKYGVAYSIWAFFDESLKKLGIKQPMIELLDLMESSHPQSVLFSHEFQLNDTSQVKRRIFERFEVLYNEAMNQLLKKYGLENHLEQYNYKVLTNNAISNYDIFFSTNSIKSRITELFGGQFTNNQSWE